MTTTAQDVVFSVAIADGSTGASLVSSSSTTVQSLDTWAQHYQGLVDMMMCATEGSRLVGAVPASELSPDAATSMGLTEDGAIAVVLDLQKVYLPAADGAPQYNDRRGMPSVRAGTGRPSRDHRPRRRTPADVAVEVLKKGDGPAVGATTRSACTTPA